MGVDVELSEHLAALSKEELTTGLSERADACEAGPAALPVKEHDDGDERTGLLDGDAYSKEVSASGTDVVDIWTILRELKTQAKLAGPIAANLLMIGIMGNITLSFSGYYGTEELAAAALSGSLTFMFGRLPMIGLSCALDTMASQAFGAGQVSSLSLIFQRTVAFLAMHCIGLSALVAIVPLVLKSLGWEPQLCSNLFKFGLALLPSIWLDVLNRPMNRILVAQKITTPQAVISVVVTLLHLGLNFLFVKGFRWSFVCVAAAQSVTALITFLLSAAYFALWGRGYCCWGKGPSLAAFKEWKPYARIAYPACVMECAESWCWGSMNLMAGLLPNPARTVAALSIAFSLFTSMFFVYLSQGLACSTRVGNSLGAGDARQARVSMMAARCWVPITWLFSAFLFTEPHIRRLLTWLYTDGTDQELTRHIGNLLWLMIALNLVDGCQCVLTGVIQGLGRQAVGLRVNLVAFYVIAIPAAYCCGFIFGWGVEGLYCGLIMGATTQAAAFAYYIAQVDWETEAHNAYVRVRNLSSAEAVESSPG